MKLLLFWLALASGLMAQVKKPVVAAKATELRLAGKLEEAIPLYKQGLRTHPGWAEGWYFLGAMHYERDQARECADAMKRFVKLAPEVSSGYAFLGLCQFQSRDYADSLRSLNRAERLGLPRGDPLTDVASYHAAQLFTKDGNFEKALDILNFFSNREPLDPKVIEAAGITALRMPIFPQELKIEDRELVYRTGRAILTAGNRRTAEATRMLDSIAKDFPTTPNVHYVYGSLLVSTDPDKGIGVLQKELEIQPDHLASRVLLAMEFLKRGEPDKAIPYGEQAATLAPVNFTGHVMLGRALVESGVDLERGIRELEAAMKLEPTSPQVRIALASAYAKAGRKEEATAQRNEFQRLKKLLEEQGK